MSAAQLNEPTGNFLFSVLMAFFMIAPSKNVYSEVSRLCAFFDGCAGPCAGGYWAWAGPPRPTSVATMVELMTNRRFVIVFIVNLLTVIPLRNPLARP